MNKIKFTNQFIDEQLLLAEKATARPWLDPWKQGNDAVPGIYNADGQQVIIPTYYDVPQIAICEEDGAYLSAAANHYPAALAALKHRNDEHRELLDALRTLHLAVARDLRNQDDEDFETTQVLAQALRQASHIIHKVEGDEQNEPQ